MRGSFPRHHKMATVPKNHHNLRNIFTYVRLGLKRARSGRTKRELRDNELGLSCRTQLTLAKMQKLNLPLRNPKQAIAC